MSFIAGWNRPSSLLLMAVVTANVLVPVAHFWPDDHAAAEGRPANHRETVAAPRVRVEPVHSAAPARRVAHRRVAPVCRAWGPFAEIAEAETLARRLELGAGSFEVFEAVHADRQNHLVTVRALESWQDADRLVAELAAHDIDSHLLDPRPDGHVLAVGVFSSERRAAAQRRRLEELGYQAAVEPLQSARRTYHLLARVVPQAAAQLPASSACGDIAPLQQFL